MSSIKIVKRSDVVAKNDKIVPHGLYEEIYEVIDKATADSPLQIAIPKPVLAIKDEKKRVETVNRFQISIRQRLLAWRKNGEIADVVWAVLRSEDDKSLFIFPRD